jgi:FkbM family methyltransferase
MRLMKSAVKSVLRSAVRWRLHNLPLSAQTAERWADRIKQWPAVLNDALLRREVVLAHDVRMQVGIVDHIERQLWLQGVWDRPVKQVLESVLAPGDAYIDLGANIGYFTLLASRLVGREGLVVAVEPSVRALRKLTHHLWLNKCGNVLLLSCAAADVWRRGELGLATESNIGGSSVVAKGTPPCAMESVWLAPLDDLLQGTDVRPKLIKLDLEGFELAALRGARRLIEQHHPWIVCEITESFLRKYDASTEQLMSFLMERGYRPFLMEDSPTSRRWLPIEEPVGSVSAGQHDVLFVPPGCEPLFGEKQ